MSEETVSAALRGAPETHRGMTTIGLYNVKRRILLNHGNGFGMDVQSEAAVCTVVRLRLPRIAAET